VRYAGQREVFVNENHFGTSVCLFVCLFDDFFCFAECQLSGCGIQNKAISIHAAHQLSRHAVSSCGCNCYRLVLTSPKHCPKYVTDYPYCSVILEV